MKTYARDIPMAWHHIRDARTLVVEALADASADLRDATAMAISELLENAMKYGESVPTLPGASYTLTVSDQEIRIDVKNGIGATEPLEQLRARVDAMAAAEDKEALYIERLQEILENPAAGGRLGLYRIACEGGFDLACSFEAPIVTVTATRARK
ncbi:MAG: hypothetical protein KF850_17955 [Labilithrix sp.]|nr:hypothetical protein [Labilithrix sp.]